MNLFRRSARTQSVTLGDQVIASSVGSGSVVGEHCVGLVYGAAGQARRVGAAHRLVLHGDQVACCFHPGPYRAVLSPFAAAPEMGLQLDFVLGEVGPREPHQRFDLFLISEARGNLTLAAFEQVLQVTLQDALRQGVLDLPPCTSLDEWHAFRAGMNELLYVRFGVTVNDCLPVDLGERVDFAQMLRARATKVAQAEPETLAARAERSCEVRSDQTGSAQLVQLADTDGHALRRLFLELPGLTHALRLVALPPGPGLLDLHQSLLRRLDLIGVGVDTMPSFEWATPDRRRAADARARAARASADAVRALDEGWSLLARLKDAPSTRVLTLLDEADRIVANLEHGTTARRMSEALT